MTTKLPAGLLTGKDRRATPRRIARARIKIECRRGIMGLGPNHAESLFDLSQTGARIIATAELAENQDVELSLEAATHRRPLKLEATVVWKAPTEDERFFVGMRLRKTLNYAELMTLT
jgi:hypothetical protein